MKPSDKMHQATKENRLPEDKDVKEYLFEEKNYDMPNFRNNTHVFFMPDSTFIKWLINYANERLIFEIGCGSGLLLKMLLSHGYHKITGIDPNWDYTAEMQHSYMEDRDPVQVLPWKVSQAKDMIRDCSKTKEKDEFMAFNQTLFIFARPCHGTFVEEAIDYMEPGTEILYITKPDNLIHFNDLGKYKPYAKQIEFEGISEDDEVVLSLIKP